MAEFVLLLTGALITAGVTGGGWYLYQRRSRQIFFKNERLLSPWQKLAMTNQLTFVPGQYRRFKASNAYLDGIYGGHQVKLDTFHRSESDEKNYIYTRIAVVVNLEVRGQTADSRNRQEVKDQTTVERVIRSLTLPDLSAAKWPVQTRANGYEIYYEQRDIQTDVSYLQTILDILINQANAHATLLNLGGEAIQNLQNLAEVTADISLSNTATQLMRGIALKTTRDLADQTSTLLCPFCLTRFGPHEVRLSRLDKLTFYGCRLCRQSCNTLKGQVIAALNNQRQAEVVEKNGRLYVNWLTRRALFDFDEVAIGQTTDETVERFAVQVGNDTDQFRMGRYSRMCCVISPESDLSENTIRILGRIFGQVEGID